MLYRMISLNNIFYLSVWVSRSILCLVSCVCGREHYQWNMDIWGVEGMEAEAELLSAVVACFKTMNITSADVGIKVRTVSSYVDRPLVPYSLAKTVMLPSFVLLNDPVADQQS